MVVSKRRVSSMVCERFGTMNAINFGSILNILSSATHLCPRCSCNRPNIGLCLIACFFCVAILLLLPLPPTSGIFINYGWKIEFEAD